MNQPLERFFPYLYEYLLPPQSKPAGRGKGKSKRRTKAKLAKQSRRRNRG